MSPITPSAEQPTPAPTGAISEHATPVLYGSPPPIPSPRVPVMGASWPPVPAQSSSGPPVPVLGTQKMLLALPLLQQLVLVRAGRLILHAHRGRCACWMLHTYGLHVRRLHLPRGAPSVHSQWDWAPHGAACWPAAGSSRTAFHTSLHTCPTSHTVMSGDATGTEVSGVPGVPLVAEEAPSEAPAIAVEVDQLTLKVKF